MNRFFDKSVGTLGIETGTPGLEHGGKEVQGKIFLTPATKKKCRETQD